MSSASPQPSLTARGLPRVGVAFVAAVVTALAAALALPIMTAILLGWTVGATVYLAWTWWVLRSLTPEQARAHARDEDPGRKAADLALTITSLASVAGVVLMIAEAASDASVLPALVGLAAVAASWGVIQALYTIRYAAAYYSEPAGGIDFNEDDAYLPDYRDFAYVAFTLGMTYAIADTNLATRPVRRLVLQHALLSYLFGAVVLAMTINVVWQLAA